MTTCSEVRDARLWIRSLKLIWRPAPHTGRLVVGTLARGADGSYTFQYDGPDLERAHALGFRGYGSVDEASELSGSVALAMFAARVPNKARPDYRDLLRSWGLSPEESDPFFVLAATGGRLPTDSFEFIPELEPVAGTCIYADVAGYVYHPASESVRSLVAGTPLELRHEPTNEFDPCAVGIYHGDAKIGFVKKVLSSSVVAALASGLQVECCLHRLRANGELSEVVVRLTFEQ